MEKEARRAVADSMWIIRECRTAQRSLPGWWEQSNGGKLKASWKRLGRGWLWGQQEQLWATAYTIRLPALQHTLPAPPAADLGCPYSKLPYSLWRLWFPKPKKPASSSCSLHSNSGLLLLYFWHGLSVPPPQTPAGGCFPPTVHISVCPIFSPHPPFPCHCFLWPLQNLRSPLLLVLFPRCWLWQCECEAQANTCSGLSACTLLCASFHFCWATHWSFKSTAPNSE